MAANIIEPPKSYSDIVATPQRNVRKSQNNIHNPKPTSFTAQTGQTDLQQN